MSKRLTASKTQPKPNATIPPKARITHVLLFSFKKPNCWSKKGEMASNEKVVANSLTVFTTNAASKTANSERARASSIKAILTAHTTAVTNATRIPLNKTFLANPLDLPLS